MATDTETYYRDHWLEVEPERLEAYERMFVWRRELEPLLAPAQIAKGLAVVDYGCGPGHLSVELARRVGRSGHVHALDINSEFLTRTRARADAQGVGGQVSVERVEQGQLPLDDDSVDRVVCKNVLEYVDDPAATVQEFRRVLRPDGLAHVTDSDWGMLVLEPFEQERISRLMSAAAVAFKTPLIGRSLYRLFRGAGFQDVRVEIRARADTEGHMRPVLANMRTYARASGRVGEPELEAIEADIEKAIVDQTYLAILPQFLVTGRA